MTTRKPGNCQGRNSACAPLSLTNAYTSSNCTDTSMKEENVAAPKLSRMEYQIMEALWEKSEISLREIQESFAAARRPAYTTVQTMVYRLEAKGIGRRGR